MLSGILTSGSPSGEGYGEAHSGDGVGVFPLEFGVYTEVGSGTNEIFGVKVGTKIPLVSGAGVGVGVWLGTGMGVSVTVGTAVATVTVTAGGSLHANRHAASAADKVTATVISQSLRKVPIRSFHRMYFNRTER